MIDCFNDPYQRRATASLMRTKFNSIKKTKEFMSWRKKQQFKIQLNQCAWCRVSFSSKGVIVHIDHITPLYFEGKNDYSNYVLSCGRCNIKKWIRNDMVKPDWVKNRELSLEKRVERHKTISKQYAIARELNDELIMEEIMSFIG